MRPRRSPVSQSLQDNGSGRWSPRSTKQAVSTSYGSFSGMMYRMKAFRANRFCFGHGAGFAKFSRPTARVRFSRNAVVFESRCVPSLMFRMANEQEEQILEAQIHVVLIRSEVTKEGESIRCFYDLQLVRDRNALFALSWTAIHTIDRHSPLFDATNDC